MRKSQTLIDAADLPTLPKIGIELNALIKRNANRSAFAELLHTEPALSTRILKMANSAIYSPARPIDNIDDAIKLLGLATLQQLIMTSVAVETFAGIENNLFDMKHFWHQSVYAMCSFDIQQKRLEHLPTQALSTTALLIYIGKLILYVAEPETSQLILSRCMEENIPQHELEHKLLGVTHAELGATQLQIWHLPIEIYQPIRFYLNPAGADDANIHTAAMLNVANYMQSNFMEDIPLANILESPDSSALDTLNCDLATIQQLFDPTAAHYHQVIELIGL